MNLTLYKTTNADNVINKVKTDDYAITINLKRDTNWLYPEILLTAIENVDFNDFNYCHLDVIEKYYFIRSIESMGNKISKLICECDFLESNKSKILASSGKLRRKAKSGDNGAVSLNLTGKVNTTIIESSVELEETPNSIMSITRW